MKVSGTVQKPFIPNGSETVPDTHTINEKDPSMLWLSRNTGLFLSDS